MENMTIWEALRRPPLEALKRIQGGRLAGKTDINPQWRYKAMTEQFGVCGIGWIYTIDKLWLETSGDEVCAFAAIGLKIKVDGEWSEPIPGIGGSMLVAKESSGLHVSDEAYKMAITDALSVAMKMIGVAADIYAGLFDGSKYTEVKKSPTPETKTETFSEQKAIIEHWCLIHGVSFSRKTKGDEEWYSHKIEGTSIWCNEPEPAPDATKSISSLPEGESSSIPFKNIGEVLTKATKLAKEKGVGFTSKELCDYEGVKGTMAITDFDRAWKSAQEIIGQKLL